MRNTFKVFFLMQYNQRYGLTNRNSTQTKSNLRTHYQTGY